MLARAPMSKPSKAPLYAEALRLYLSAERPDLGVIATQVGLSPLGLIDCAAKQSWDKRRALVQRDASMTRPAIALRVDEALVSTTCHHVEHATQAWQALVERVAALPVEPDADAYPETEADRRAREHTRLLRAKIDLMRQVSQGVREMTEAAMVLGLAQAPSKDGPQDGKLDLSKLTQLNVTINQALEQARPVTELPTAPKTDGGF